MRSEKQSATAGLPAKEEGRRKRSEVGGQRSKGRIPEARRFNCRSFDGLKPPGSSWRGRVSGAEARGIQPTSAYAGE